MIKFTIEKIQLRNVRCYGDDIMEMDFPLNNLTVFTGKVGAGKSTILKAVSMALYGEDGGAKNEKLNIDDMLNEKNGKNLEIHLFISAIDTLDNHEDKYEIHLYYKHSKMQNKLVFIKNGKDISANGKMDTYRLIEKTFIPRGVYHNIYYFTQQAKNFFTALPNGEQKEIFDSILDLSEYDEYYKNCRTKLTELEFQLKSINDNITNKESDIKLFEKIINDENEKIKQNEIDHEFTLKSLEKEIGNLKELIDDHLNLLNGLKSSDEAKSQLSELETEYKLKISKLDNDIEALSNKLSEVDSKFKNEFETLKIKASNDYKELIKPFENKINDLKQQITVSDSKHNSVLNDYRYKYNEEYGNLINKKTDELHKIDTKINEIKQTILTYQNTIKDDFNKKNQDIQKIISDIKETINGLNIKLNEIKSLYSHNEDEINKLRKQYDKNQKQLNSDTPICDKCGQPLVNLSKLEKEQKDISNSIDELNSKTVQYSIDINKLSNDIKIKNDELSNKLNEVESLKISFRNTYDTKKNEFLNQIQKLESDKFELNNFYDDKVKNDLKPKYSKLMDIENDNYKDENDKLNNEIDSVKEKIDIETSKLKTNLLSLAQEYRNKISDGISNINTDLKAKKDSKQTITKDYIEKINQKKIELMYITDKEKDLQNYKQKVNLKENEYEIESKKVIDTRTLNTTKESLNNHIKIYDECKKKQKELTKTIEILEFWKKAFSDSGIKSMLIDVAIPHMNKCVKEELERVYPGVFTISFDTLSETKSGEVRDRFSINVVHNIKCATGHKKLSGGEKRIIDFCCMAALRSLAEKLYGKMFRHIFYDEVMDSLDSECREFFCRSMKYQLGDERNITLITHALTEDVDPDRIFPF